MIRDAPALDSSWTVEEAAKHIAGAKGSVAAYPVLDAEGHLVGMVETTVVTGAADRGPGGRRIGELARPATVHVHPDQPLDTALVKLGRHGVSALAVVSREDTRVLLGVVTTQAIAAAMAREAGEAGEETAP
jgi:CBS domain-containing protein